jgi:hypothetical protein
VTVTAAGLVVALVIGLPAVLGAAFVLGLDAPLTAAGISFFGVVFTLLVFDFGALTTMWAILLRNSF